MGPQKQKKKKMIRLDCFLFRDMDCVSVPTTIRINGFQEKGTGTPILKKMQTVVQNLEWQKHFLGILDVKTLGCITWGRGHCMSQILYLTVVRVSQCYIEDINETMSNFQIAGFQRHLFKVY